MLVIWLRIVHSDDSVISRSAGVDVFIGAVSNVASPLGLAIERVLAVTVILSAGRFDAAYATCWRTMNAAATTRARTSRVMIGERRTRRTMAIRASWVWRGDCLGACGRRQPPVSTRLLP